jgi:hypothetical protein
VGRYSHPDKSSGAIQSCVSGLLKADNNGGTSLELDGYLPSENGPMSAMEQGELPRIKFIRGLLVCVSALVNRKVRWFWPPWAPRNEASEYPFRNSWKLF